MGCAPARMSAYKLADLYAALPVLGTTWQYQTAASCMAMGCYSLLNETRCEGVCAVYLEVYE